MVKFLVLICLYVCCFNTFIFSGAFMQVSEGEFSKMIFSVTED